MLDIKLHLLCLATGLAVCSGSSALAVDLALVGKWRTTFDLAGLTVTMDLDIRQTGDYTLSAQGPQPLFSEQGSIQAGNNSWKTQSSAGRSDGGTYEVLPDRLVLRSSTGLLGESVWLRSTRQLQADGTARGVNCPPYVRKEGGGLGKLGVKPKMKTSLFEQIYMSLTAPCPGSGACGQQNFKTSGLAQMNRGDYPDAATCFTSALNSGDRDVSLHFNRALCFLAMANSPKYESVDRRKFLGESLSAIAPVELRVCTLLRFLAAGDLTHVIAAEPENSRAWCVRGVAKLQEGYYRAAHFDFSKAIQYDPNNALAYGYRATVRRRLGKPYKYDLQKCFRLDPGLQKMFITE